MNWPVIITILAAVGSAFAVAASWVVIREVVRNHRTLVGIERDLGHQENRLTMRRRTARDMRSRDLIARSQYLKGWVWIRVQYGRPVNGRTPESCQVEQVEWACTRRGINRKKARATESGEIETILLWVVVLIAVSAVVSSAGTDMTPGAVLDWVLNKAADLLTSLFG